MQRRDSFSSGRVLICGAVLAALFLVPASATAQDAGGQPQPAPAPPDPRDVADRRPNFVEPDFTLVNLPTTLRLPRYKSAFRITHRFARTLNDDFGRVASDLFGLDSGALIGLEYRFGVMRGLQAGIYRTSGKTIQFFGHDLMRQSASVPFTLNAVASIEGLNNFHRGNVVEERGQRAITPLSTCSRRTSFIPIPTARPVARSTSSTGTTSPGAPIWRRASSRTRCWWG
jgi:hypothetical protein